MSNIKFDVKNLNLHYGKFHALKDVNMEIPEKQITAFIGPSGCGKSTFLKCLNRMNDLVEGCNITGDVKLDGEDIFDGMGLLTPEGPAVDAEEEAFIRAMKRKKKKKRKGLGM